MNQEPFDFEGAARHSDPGTSHEAAASIDAGALALQVFELLDDHRDGLTTGEIAQILKLPRDSISPRIAPLMRKGVVEDSGGKRPGPTGRAQIVWRVVRE